MDLSIGIKIKDNDPRLAEGQPARGVLECSDILRMGKPRNRIGKILRFDGGRFSQPKAEVEWEDTGRRTWVKLAMIGKTGKKGYSLYTSPTGTDSAAF